MRGARPPREDDRIIGGAVAEAARADEVHALQAPCGILSLAVTVAGERSGDEDGRCERREESEGEDPETHAA